MTIDTKRIASDDAGAPGEDDPMKAAIELSLFDRAPFSPEDLVDTFERQQRGIETQLIWLQLATRSYDIEFWIFEPQANVLNIYFIDDEGVLQKRVFEDMPDSAIQSGMVHPESASSVRRLFDAIRSGAPHGGATARVRHHGHPGYEWCALSFRLVGSGSDPSPRAIGICRDLETPNRPGPDRSPFPDSLYPHLIRASYSDLDEGRLEYLMKPDNDLGYAPVTMDYGHALEAGSQIMFTDADRRTYRKLLDPAAVRERYDAGRRWAIDFLRVVQPSGSVAPARIAACARRRSDGHLWLTTITNGCAERTSWEASTAPSVVRDPKTMLYRYDYASLVVETILSASEPEDPCALAIIKVPGSTQRSAALSADIACGLAVFLGTECVTFSLDEETIAAFIAGMSAPDAVSRRVRAACESVRESVSDELPSEGKGSPERFAFTVGIVYGTATAFALEPALVRAHSICEQRMDLTRDTFVRPVPIAGHCAHLRGNDIGPETADAIEALNPGEATAYAKICTRMLSAPTATHAIDTAIHGLGIFHMARRVYVAMVNHADMQLDIMFEWDAAGITPIRTAFSNSPVSRFPFIEQNLAQADPVYFERERTANAPVMPDDGEMWSFALVPVSRNDMRTMVLCIDQPQERCEHWRLDRLVADRLLSQWSRLSTGTLRAEEPLLDELEAMPGETGLDRELAAAESSSWLTVGVLYVSVQDPAGIVTRSGFSGAIRVFLKVTSTLNRIFGREHLYRISDTDFVTLYPDSSYHAFIQRCASTRSALYTSNPEDILIGAAWTDSKDKVWRTLNEARVTALSDRPADAELLRRIGIEPGKTPIPIDVDALAETTSIRDRFTVFLQPKIDVRTGEMIGAEALARALAPDGKPVSPVREIERLEQAGRINELDYFILEQTLELLSTWRAKGLCVKPISSNFSRFTLMGSTALASVLAIMSRFPDVPSDLMEMEITETAIDLGKTTLSELVERYRSLGLRVALDDFGSRYSNVAVLANVHFDTVKLDGSVTRGLPENDVSRSLVHNIAEICAAQGMTCVAEGVESRDQAIAIANEGCPICQGFYYDKPLPPEIFEQKYLRLDPPPVAALPHR